MIVTQITGITKGRFRIYIEEKPAFVLYRGEVRRLGIREGEPLSEESLREIEEEILLIATNGQREKTGHEPVAEQRLHRGRTAGEAAKRRLSGVVY